MWKGGDNVGMGKVWVWQGSKEEGYGYGNPKPSPPPPQCRKALAFLTLLLALRLHYPRETLGVELGDVENFDGDKEEGRCGQMPKAVTLHQSSQCLML